MKIQTLHVYNCDENIDVNNYLPFVSFDDLVLIICDEITKTRYKLLQKLLAKHKTLFLIRTNHNNLTSISYSDWVKLLAKSKKTMTWK
ncbi:MAG TPA: hypothetical protein ENJ44_02250 [Oceanospirillales bacterium]|nr:hypothetical protein [Oceanospirillales bacterium]